MLNKCLNFFLALNIMPQIVNKLFSPLIFSVHNFRDIKIQLSNDEVEFNVTPTSANRTRLNWSRDAGS